MVWTAAQIPIFINGQYAQKVRFARFPDLYSLSYAAFEQYTGSVAYSQFAANLYLAYYRLPVGAKGAKINKKLSIFAPL